jgi:hypothetical protein
MYRHSNSEVSLNQGLCNLVVTFIQQGIKYLNRKMMCFSVHTSALLGISMYKF